MEEIVKNLIRESLEKRLIGWGKIDPILVNSALINCWLTDIMALGYNNFDLEAAAKDIYEIEIPMMGVLMPQRFLEDYRASIFLSNNRFFEEICAFQKYAELRNKESEEVILDAVKQELEGIEDGSFVLL
ncbi:MAG: hypothetical protein LBR10_13020 [Prevotellaceae bacterium]|jgi:hypothetical protein|nr:hypothetical protein [Prevotellaceae bacterium]